MSIINEFQFMLPHDHNVCLFGLLSLDQWGVCAESGGDEKMITAVMN